MSVSSEIKITLYFSVSKVDVDGFQNFETREEVASSLCLLRLDALELGDVVLNGRQGMWVEFVSFHIQELLIHQFDGATVLGMADLIEVIRAP